MPRDVNIYCDESRYSNPCDPFLVIGAMKCQREKKREIVRQLDALKHEHGIGGEFGWKSVSKNKGDFYRAAIDWFLGCDDLLFRCVVARKDNLWSRDDEDGFYVVYHQLLYHWLEAPNAYHIYLDEKRNSKQWQVDVLKRKTEDYMPGGCTVACVEEVSSRECTLVQEADFLIGCVGYAWNCHTDRACYPHGSEFKRELCYRLARGLGRPSLCFSTWASERKFNVFHFGE
ncbi:DUF3800 domain-containing protein [Olsenella porci]|uniref:DUF3800 domain-containing protein n=1 Tax=Olsenella porci TaxID=2652279 RepID=A0A6N7XQV7_9ACTN|nr:DUF3800 domain-containing protein [Olsenella porci]MST72309.1 DUF3800 domain-containing protein [Olsenella porci]